LTQGRLARPGVPVGNRRGGVHGAGFEERVEILKLVPGSLLEGLADQVLDLLFQGTVIGDALAALAGLLGGEGFGGAFALEKAGPAVVRAVELGGLGFADAVGFAAGGAGGGKAAGQQRQGDLESEGCLVTSALFYRHGPNVYIH
jgi:hypothetical protein